MKSTFKWKGLYLNIAFLLTSFISSAQLTGTKTIPGSYATISAAVTALNASGVGPGGVTFNVAANYTETITATISLTASGTVTDPIVFQKDPSTSGANPLVTSYTAGVGTPATAVQDGIWRLIGSDYITIDGIDLKDNSSNTTNPSTMEYGYALYKASTSNGCQYVTIKNCVITLHTINNATGTSPMVDGSAGIIVMNARATAATTALIPIVGGTNSNNKFYSNTIQKCNIGIALIGYAAASPFTLADTNNDIGGNAAATGNTILNYGGAAAATNPAAAIRTLAQHDLIVSYNTINNNNGGGTNHPAALRGIYVNTATSAISTITNNTITLKGGGTTQAIAGIENVSGSTAASNTVTITNNTITNSTYTTATTGGFYGIYNNGATPASLIIKHNTISNNSSAATTTGFLYGIYNNGAASMVTIDSNTISGNSTAALTTGRFCGIYNIAAVPNLSISGNTIAGSTTSAASGLYCAILNTGAATSAINIDYNNIGTAITPAISFSVANSGTQNMVYNTGGASTADLSISNNNIQGIAYAVAGTGANSYIINTAATHSQAINNNSFTNLSVNTTGNITFIADNVVIPATGSQNINNNAIVGSFAKTSAGGTVTLFSSNTASISGAVINYNNNNFSNITVTGATVIAGWVNTDAGAGTKTIQNNTFSNWTGGTSAVTGMAVNITSTNNYITGNTINSITSTGAITGITTGAGNNNIYSNTVYGLHTTGASAVTGIAVTSGTSNKVYRNKIYDLQSNSATGTVNGILISGATVVAANIYNNTIGDLKTPSTSAADPIRGISVTANAANSNINVYNNTVHLNASSTGTNFGCSGIYQTTNATATTATLNLRNNIIVNTSTPNGTGYAVAYRRSNATLTNYGTSSNNNLFYAGTPGAKKLIFYDGTNADQTITLYKARVSTRDAQSVTEDITTKFLSISGSSSSFLHLDATKATLAESGAVNISGITEDFDTNVRYGNPGYADSGTGTDIGADEFNGIAVPLLSGSYNVGIGEAYTSLTGAGGLFAAINSIGLSGNVIVNITSDLTEDGSNSLYKWSETGAGNYVVIIRPDAATVKTISGDVIAGMIRFNNASRVIIDGSYSGSGRYLTFRNLNTSGTTGTAFTFINGATNNIIRYCNIEAYANATNGAILFSTSTIAGGNSNNQISYCSITATVGANSGNVCIYSAGTTGKENSANTISYNNIYNYRDRALDITAKGSTGWNISDNSFYNGTVSGAINYPAASTLHGIRILGGSGYSILNNYIGGNTTQAGGTNAIYASTLGNVAYQGILLTTNNSVPASYIKGNTIASISLSSVPTVANSTAFIGIETNGSGVSIGGISVGDGNTIGSATGNSSVTVSTSTSTATFNSIIRGINCLSSGGLVIGNHVGGIDISNTGSAPAPSSCLGIYVNNASAPAQVNLNIVGSVGTTNSIRILSTSSATTTSITGIYIGNTVVSAVQVNANTVQNISHLSTATIVTPGGITGIRSAAIGAANISITNNTVDSNYIASHTTGVFYGIYNSGACANVSINNNTIAANVIGSASGGHYAIYNAGAVTSAVNINGNNLGTSTLPAFKLNAANSGTHNFIYNTGGAATCALSISNNNIRGVTYAVAGSCNNTYIINSAATLSQAINNNTFINLVANTTGNITFISDNVVVPATGSQNVNGNNISGTFSKTGAGGTVTLFTSSASSAAGSIINNNSNNFSNITVSGTTVIAGWLNTDAGSSTKNIQNNTFSNWTGGTGAITGMSVNITGSGNATTGNAINNFSSAGAITGITTGAGNDRIYSNTINSLYSTGASNITGIAVTGGTTKKVYRNKLYDLQVNNAGGTVYGISVSGGLSDSIYNNIIGDLRTPSGSGADIIRGISVTSTVANSAIGVYYNTIYLNASSSATNFGTSGIYHTTSTTATTAVLDLRNNSITNISTPNGTGFTVAYRRSSTTLTNYATSSNNNLYYSGVAGATKLIFYDGTNKDQTISAYKTRVSARDAQSVTDDLISTSKFLSTTGSSISFLHMDASKTSLVNGGAVNISGITTDFDQQIRSGNPGYAGSSSTPDIGADEITSTTETTPPTIVYTPLADTTAITNRNIGGIIITDASNIDITSGTNPRIYYKRISDANSWIDNTPATNGWKYAEATNATSPFNFTIDYSILYAGGGSITAGNVQYFIVAQDLASTPNVAINSGTFSATPSSVALTSAAFPIGGTINSYKITCFTVSAGSNSPVCAGGTVSLTAIAPSAVSPTYSWTNPNYTVVSSIQEPTVAALAGNYTVTVTDASGCIDSATTTVALTTRPTAVVSGTAAICNGDSVIINIAVTGNGTISGTLSNGDPFSGLPPLITILEGPASNTTYTITSLSDSFCTSLPADLTGSAVITVNSGLWTGASNSDWSDASNWCGGMPSDLVNATIPAGLTHYPVLSSSVSARRITIAAGATLTIPAVYTLSVFGNFNNSGNLVNNGSIILSGTTAQSFPGTNGTISAMNNLEVNNAAGVNINQSFTLSGTLTSTAGTIDLNTYTITLLSDSDNTARVAPVTGGFAYTGGGKFIVQRYIPARRSWRLMTAPLTNSNTFNDAWQNSGVYTPGKGLLVSAPGGGAGIDKDASSSLKSYDVASQLIVPVTRTNTSISLGHSGSADNTGYFIFIRGDRNPANFSTANKNITTISSAGELQTGPQTFTGATTADYYSLIGNPYASPIDFTNISRMNVIKRFYAWDPALNNSGGYVMLDDLDDDGVFSKSVPGSAQTKEIQSHQAFFVQTMINGASSLTINESDKSGTNNNLVFRPVTNTESLSAELYLLNTDNSTILADGTTAEFNDIFSEAVNYQDAVKFGNVNEALALERNGKSLTMERRPVIKANDSLFLKLTKTTQRAYQLKLSAINLNKPGMTAMLKDNFLGTSTAIDLGGVTKVNFSITANAASSNANRFTVVFRPAIVLPVTFTTVKAYQREQFIAVDWNVANETSIAAYEVEKSIDRTHFSKLNTLPAKGNNTAAVSYTYLDEKPSTGNNFYRIKSISLSGEVKYSQVVNLVTGTKGRKISVYPNPLQDNVINLQFVNEPVGNYKLRLINNAGQVIYSSEVTTSSNNTAQVLSVSQTLPKGIYRLELKGPGNTVSLQQVMVQ